MLKNTYIFLTGLSCNILIVDSLSDSALLVEGVDALNRIYETIIIFKVDIDK